MIISVKEFEAVMKLSAFDRYKYFIKKVGDSELMYTIIDANGNLAIAEGGGKNVLSFWPAAQSAMAVVTNEWKDYK